jgi:hypothetical protein
MKYLAASILIAAAAAVYGLFSHGVYSYFMTYAFMIPLLAGAVPHLISALKRQNATKEQKPFAAKLAVIASKILDAKDTQLAVIATLTAGSILKGVLDIYGTTNRLLIAYPAAAVLVVAAAAVMVLKNKKKQEIIQ